MEKYSKQVSTKIFEYCALYNKPEWICSVNIIKYATTQTQNSFIQPNTHRNTDTQNISIFFPFTLLLYIYK